MFNKYKEFFKIHPYAYIIVITLFASFIGISLEYIVNKDFIGTGLYSALGLAVIEMLRVRRRK